MGRKRSRRSQPSSSTALTSVNTKWPTYNLPYDILSDIFIIVEGPTQNDPGKRLTIPAVSQVSRHWRDVALSTLALWSRTLSLRIDKYTPGELQILSLYMDRCVHLYALLDVRLSYCKVDEYDEARLYQCSSVLMRHIPRWRSITLLSWNNELLADFFGYARTVPAPNLQRINVFANEPKSLLNLPIDQWLDTTHKWRTPALAQMHLISMSCPAPVTFDSLTTLHLVQNWVEMDHHDPWYTWTPPIGAYSRITSLAFKRLIRATPQLQHLVLDKIWFNEEWLLGPVSSKTMVVAESIRTMEIVLCRFRHATYDVLQHISFPLLEKLTLSGFNSFHPGHKIPKLEFPNVRTLVLRNTVDVGRVQTIYDISPQVRELCLIPARRELYIALLSPLKNTSIWPHLHTISIISYSNIERHMSMSDWSNFLVNRIKGHAPIHKLCMDDRTLEKCSDLAHMVELELFAVRAESNTEARWWKYSADETAQSEGHDDDNEDDDDDDGDWNGGRFR